MEGGGGGQEEDQVDCHEQRDWEVEVEAMRGGLDEALAETKSDKVFLLNKFIERGTFISTFVTKTNQTKPQKIFGLRLR